MGRLSNASEPAETVIDQGTRESRRQGKGVSPRGDASKQAERDVADEQTGRLSNPPCVQRRLSSDDVEGIVVEHVHGRSLR